MLSKVRLKKYRKIKEGPKKLKFGASKTGVREAPSESAPAYERFSFYFINSAVKIDKIDRNPFHIYLIPT